ncbi:urease accessory protein F [Trichonephila clavata]|uniref:Urease accessory protein F n=1 Tax=Trichonephila clavata TaxID=2740835 RepID=A0A8X6LYW4_TRICU|nr:urease accessory protein F [Trichonephila clavata]
MEKNKLYTILQLCDSAFPTGGFSHSMGTEAATQNLYINDFDSLKVFILSCLENAGSSCIPFVRAAYENANNLQKVMLLDSIHNATLLNHVAHRASKLQGKSFLTTSCKVFKLPLMEKLKDLADDEKVHCHLSIVFATVCATLNIPSLEVGKMYLFNCLRTIIASIVRLGKVGTIQAQHLQFEIQCCLDDILKRNWSLHPEESCISYPLTETLQNSHDTMFSKLFFS